MIKNIYWLQAPALQPFVNQGWEKSLLDLVGPDELILYLWQNQHTVVLGRHQNPWRECDVRRLQADGGLLARRISGGGAVYHDADNLNFSFILRRGDYDLGRQQQVILQALQQLGVNAQLSGRNDIVADGRKLSGNAFWRGNDRCLHHGTLLLRVDAARMSAYLQPSRQKLAAKGVDSTPARVVGIKEIAPAVELKQLQLSLIEQLGRVYARPPQPFELARLDTAALWSNQQFFADPNWRLAQPLVGNWYREQRFDWGELQLSLDIKDGVLQGVQVYTDALDVGLAERLTAALQDLPWPAQAEELQQRLATEAMAADIISLLRSEGEYDESSKL